MQPLAYGPPTVDTKAEGWFEPKNPRLAWVSRETLSENLQVLVPIENTSS